MGHGNQSISSDQTPSTTLLLGTVRLNIGLERVFPYMTYL